MKRRGRLEYLDLNQRAFPAEWAAARGVAADIHDGFFVVVRGFLCVVDQTAAEVEFLLSVTVGRRSVVSDAHEPVGQHVQEESADELVRLKGHFTFSPVVPVVLVE